MKFNKYVLATSVLVLNALAAPSVAIAQDTQTGSIPESSEEKITNHSPLFEENSLPNQEIQSSSDQSTTPTEETTQTLEQPENSVSSNQEGSSTEEVANDLSEEAMSSSTTPTTKKDETINVEARLSQDGWSYEKKNGYYLITSYSGNGDVVVPNQINGLPVKLKTIDKNVFPNYKEITSFKILLNEDGMKVGVENQSLYGAFYNWPSLETVDLTGLDVSNVTNMGFMFSGCSKLTSLNAGNWDTSNVTYMAAMFQGCENLTNIDTSKWNTSKVIDMRGMFSLCSSLTSLDVSQWDISNVTNIDWMFSNCKKLTDLNVSNWNTSNVTVMDRLFNNCSSLTSLDVSNWDTSNVTDMTAVFQWCQSLTSVDVSKWDTSNVTATKWMFYDTRSLKFLDLRNFNMDKVTDTNEMFKADTNNPIPLLIYTNDSKLLTYDYSKDNRVPVGPALDANGGKFKDNSSIKYYIEKIAYQSDKELSPKLDLASFESYKKEHIPTKENEVFLSWNLAEGNEPTTSNDLLNPTKYLATYKLLSVNIPSQDIDNTKPEQESVYGIAYIPKQFQISKTELNDSGHQSIAFKKTHSFDVGVRDYRNSSNNWILQAQLHWMPGKELPEAYIQTTNNAGTVMKNTNNGTNIFNPDTDLQPSNNEVTGIQNVKITSESLTPIMQTASNVAHNTVYNYNLGNVSLEIPETKSIQSGVYEGFVEWNLSNTPV